MVKKWLLGLGLLATAGVAVFAVSVGCEKRAEEARLEAEYQEQLRLARQEGLPTTWQEFAATIRTAKPEENAALLYRRLPTKPESVSKLNDDFLFRPDSKIRAEVEATLQRRKDELALLDEATQLPRCWFDRDWSLGIAVLMPEYVQMRSGVDLLVLRGSWAARAGRHADAIRDAERIQKMAAHVREEPTLISALVADRLTRTALSALVEWSMHFRAERGYVKAIEEALANMAKPNLRREFSGQLYQVLVLIELMRTPEGRAKLGLTEEDIPKLAEAIFPRLLNEKESLIKIVRAQRTLFSTLSMPLKDREAPREQAMHEFYKGLLAFPTAAKIHDSLSTSEDPRRMEHWHSWRIVYTAALRALKQPNLPKSIKTDDLRSPFDGKPVNYRLEGRQMVITLSRAGYDENDLVFKVPPDRK